MVALIRCRPQPAPFNLDTSPPYRVGVEFDSSSDNDDGAKSRKPRPRKDKSLLAQNVAVLVVEPWCWADGRPVQAERRLRPRQRPRQT